MSEITWVSMAQNLLSWLGLLVTVAGVVFTAAYLKGSRWTRLRRTLRFKNGARNTTIG
jgi:hypothetical protein